MAVYQLDQLVRSEVNPIDVVNVPLIFLKMTGRGFTENVSTDGTNWLLKWRRHNNVI
jgi:hypothetical protein